jgi:two-component system, sensor histidine kinase YesM
MKKISDRFKIFNALRAKLSIIAVVLIALPVITISFIYSRTVKEIMNNKYTETAKQSVYETGEKIDFILSDIQEFSTVIMSNNELLNMLNHDSNYNGDDYNRVLRSFITSRDDIESIDLILDGTSYSMGVKKINKTNYITKQLSTSSGQPLWMPTRKEQIEILSGKFEKNYFTLARKIIDFNTLEDFGYLLIDLEEGILKQAYGGLLDDESAEIIICDDLGNIISSSNSDKIGGNIKNEPYGGEVLSDTEEYNYVQYKTAIDKVAIYSTIKSNDWKIIKTISTDYLYKELNNIQTYFILGGVIYGLVIIIFMLVFAFRYTEPMIKMMGVIKKVEQGDLTVRTEIHSHDEVGQLGHSLNNMIAEMQVLIDRLITEEKEKKEVELEALHAQINPHFLYNTLNTIKWMAKIQGNISVSKAITALVKLLRISINLGRDMISLSEEIDYVKNYIVIQKLRFNEGINVTYSIDESCLVSTVPKLILQPIVENSIIYGITDERYELDIRIRGYNKDNKLIIEIEDDGPGIEEDILKSILINNSDKNKLSKVGLNNVNQRIKLYCGDDYGLDIHTEVGVGTKIMVRLPLNTDTNLFYKG